ncbi:RIO1 family regulatory kinase/ATPase [Halorubellus litoreus]|uniref:non-specific serine/threonine protein kinase n=1 Tax=Halorubellus litoreus TaxID=755308 RepID=A0ABD5VBE3_9EURY
MAIREFLRGTVDWTRLESVARAVAERNDRDGVRVEFLDADNWLSTPMVVDDEWFVKVVTPQNSVVHALFTAGRNLGAFSAGTEGFFDHVGTPLALAERELEAVSRMHAVGLNVPRPVDAFEVDGLGVLVLEYLPDFRTFDDLSDAEARSHATDLFALLARMHDQRIAHGDVRGENVLLQDDELYVIDATTVRDEGFVGARSYDLACALAELAPRIGARDAVAAATSAYSVSDVLAAREFLDFVALRPDHDFDANALKGEIEKAAT